MKSAVKQRSTAQQPPLLPPPVELERICKGLAALDAMMSEEWEYRYYSFNASWYVEGKERMASMRNGSGDEWFIVFAPGGVFVTSSWHEYHPRVDVAVLYAGLPATLAAHTKEHAWPEDYVTFGGWHDGTAWTLRGNAKPMADDLAILSGDPGAYRKYVAEVHEVAVPLEAIAHVLAGKPLDAQLVARITKDRTLAELQSDLAEIGYGHRT